MFNLAFVYLAALTVPATVEIIDGLQPEER